MELMRPGSLLKDRVTIVAFPLYLVIYDRWILRGALQVVDGGNTHLEERKASTSRLLLPTSLRTGLIPVALSLGRPQPLATT